MPEAVGVVTHAVTGEARPLPRRLASWVALVVLAAIPAVAGGFWTYSVGVCMANAVAVLSVGFLLRYGGEVSIGHSFFLAFGAYCTAILERQLGLSVGIGLPVAAIAGAVLGVAFAWPSRALSGIYLAIATMALALAVPELILQAGPVAGGYEGLYVSRPLVPGLSIELQRYYLPLVVLGLVVLLLARFRRSRQGLVLLTARDHPRAAEAFGFSRGYARLAAFAISAAVASVAGSLLAFSASTVSPNSFTLSTAIYLLVGTVVSFGSLGLIGALAGGAFITLVPQVFAAWGDWVPIIYGAALLLVITLGHRPAEVLAALRARLAGGRRDA
ncbi:branched-chain amino acid ABC transporter permease [Roseomonas populi]|uniref:Branched-chain amino acid ABC transporter permease n=1 Tax=Roseomonas populi TaxID=3121582 RepID=A0ABT1XBE6_9PROT|nr:branched-chain amino acid ABC transporter permease [Roseomonas pecuniae]MCR0985455.1 branched-chain amino acid ABC transporter permease [Roseomonas pecuniae]